MATFNAITLADNYDLNTLSGSPGLYAGVDPVNGPQIDADDSQVSYMLIVDGRGVQTIILYGRCKVYFREYIAGYGWHSWRSQMADAVEENIIYTDCLMDGAVKTDKIYKDAITSDKIKNNAVTSEKIANDAVVTKRILNLAVTTEKLADGSVTTDKLAQGAVNNVRILNNAVDARTIAANAVTTEKIFNGAVTEAKLDSALKSKINTPIIGEKSITTDKLADYSVTIEKIAQGAINNHRIQNNAVDARTLASDAVVTAKIQDYAVTGQKIAGNSITSSHISDGAVTESILSDSVINKLNNGMVRDDLPYIPVCERMLFDDMDYQFTSLVLHLQETLENPRKVVEEGKTYLFKYKNGTESFDTIDYTKESQEHISYYLYTPEGNGGQIDPGYDYLIKFENIIIDSGANEVVKKCIVEKIEEYDCFKFNKMLKYLNNLMEEK